MQTGSVDSSTVPPQPPYRVLAVDDSPDDLFFLDWAIRRTPLFTSVGSLSSGGDAIKYFRGESPYDAPDKAPVPDVLLLDLKMPGYDGFDVLQFLQEHCPDRKFKVVVLSSSQAPADQEKGRELGADAFATKPADHEGYIQLLQGLADRLAGQ